MRGGILRGCQTTAARHTQQLHCDGLSRSARTAGRSIAGSSCAGGCAVWLQSCQISSLRRRHRRRLAVDLPAPAFRQWRQLCRLLPAESGRSLRSCGGCAYPLCLTTVITSRQWRRLCRLLLARSGRSPPALCAPASAAPCDTPAERFRTSFLGDLPIKPTAATAVHRNTARWLKPSLLEAELAAASRSTAGRARLPRPQCTL